MISPQSPDDFEELLARLVEDRLTNEEQSRLEQILLSDPEARVRYRQLMRIHSLLHAGLARLPQGQADELHVAEVSQPSVFSHRGTVRSFFRGAAATARGPISLVAAAILVAAGVTTAYLWSGSGPLPIAHQAADPPALVIQTAMSEWETGFAPTGEVVSQGQHLKLRSGFAEIRFGSRATALLQGPAEFEVDNQNACRLRAGQLTARVPQAARGFKVHTPAGTVTDLGTEFGVFVRSEVGGRKSEGKTRDAGPSTTTEVHVFRGEVEVADDAQVRKPEIFTAGASVALDSKSGTIRRLAADPDRFVRVMPVAISIVNHDFEAGEPLGNGKLGGPFGGWNGKGDAHCFDPCENPQANGNGESYYRGSDQGPGSGIVGTMAGPQVGYLYWGRIAPSFSQTLSETAQPHTKYVLTIALGVRNLGRSIQPRDFGGCYLELLAGTERLGDGQVWDYDALNKAAAGQAHGTFTDVSYTFVTGPKIAPGQPLGIRISMPKNTRNKYLDIDNVRLLAIPLAAEGEQP